MRPQKHLYVTIIIIKTILQFLNGMTRVMVVDAEQITLSCFKKLF